MSKKTRILSLSVVGVCGFAVSSGFAQLPGNVLPNPTLSTGIASPLPGDPMQIGSGSTLGDTYLRPSGWHRGGVDFTYSTAGYQPSPPYVESAPLIDQYNTSWPTPSQGTGSPTPPASGFALEVEDNDQANYGEWFSGVEGTTLFNALPAASIADGHAYIQYSLEYTNITDTKADVLSGGGNFRVSVNYGIAGASIYNGGQIGGTQDFLIPAPISPATANQLTWLTLTQYLVIPAGAKTFDVTIDSGGSSVDTGQMWVSDLSVSAVPEPTCIAGITAGSMLLLARRRRRTS